MRSQHNMLALLTASLLFGPAGLPRVHDSVMPPYAIPLDSEPAFPDSERLVAEAIIAPIDRYGSQMVFLPVTIHAHPVTLILDSGTSGSLTLDSTGMALAGLSIPAMKDTTDSLGRSFQVGHFPLQVLDSLGIGTVEIPSVESSWMDMYDVVPPPGVPAQIVGILGAPVLRQFDLVFDGPARRVRLYQPAPERAGTSADLRGGWFPAGLTSADCVPLVPIPLRWETELDGVELQANGHTVVGFFDSGSATTNMSVAAAKLLGITQHDAHVHLLPPDSSPHFGDSFPGKVYRVTGLTLRLGTRSIHNDTALVMTSFAAAGTYPVFNLGLDAIRDRRFMISHSTHQVCLGPGLERTGG